MVDLQGLSGRKTKIANDRPIMPYWMYKGVVQFIGSATFLTCSVIEAMSPPRENQLVQHVSRIETCIEAGARKMMLTKSTQQ